MMTDETKLIELARMVDKLARSIYHNEMPDSEIMLIGQAIINLTGLRLQIIKRNDM